MCRRGKKNIQISSLYKMQSNRTPSMYSDLLRREDCLKNSVILEYIDRVFRDKKSMIGFLNGQYSFLFLIFCSLFFCLTWLERRKELSLLTCLSLKCSKFKVIIGSYVLLLYSWANPFSFASFLDFPLGKKLFHYQIKV